MSSITRALSGNVLVFDLGGVRSEMLAIAEREGRGARTLLKSGPLRATLVVLASGGGIAEHVADGAITVQPIAGRIIFTAEGQGHDLGPGDLLALEAGVRHSVASVEGATFLLTVVRHGTPPQPA